MARRADIVEREDPQKRTLSKLYEEWKNLSGLDKAVFEKAHPLLRAALSSGDMSMPGIAERKVLWRQQKDPQYERLLYKWGYLTGLNPKNPVVFEEKAKELVGAGR